jgi:hypothetical protein
MRVIGLGGKGDRSGTIRLWKEILCRQCNAPVDVTLPSWLTSVRRCHVARPW